MSNWYLGTIGYGYSEWGNVFYPPGLPKNKFLTYYSQKFNAVELDTTFYGTPKPNVIRQWAESVGDNFKFGVKTPKIITHGKGLIGVDSLMVEFLDHIHLLENKLGVILIQLPPGFSIKYLDHLESFLKILPRDTQYAIEFRNSSWYTEITTQLLSSYGVTWVSVELPNIPMQVIPTTKLLYVRWVGQHGSYKLHNFERIDKTSQLNWWHEQLIKYEHQCDTIYGFFNNDYTGYAVGTCVKFRSIIGDPIIEISSPKQNRLF